MYAVSEFIRGALADRLFLRLTPKTKKQPDANPAAAAINAAGRRRFLPLLFLAFLFCAPHPAHAACASPAGVEGQMVYNVSFHVLQYCDNLNVWNAMGTPGPGTGGAGCSGPPAGVEGQMIYNQSSHMLQWCDGTIWHAVSSGASYNSGLVGWWKMDEGTGTTTADSSGNGNTGTLTNSPTWTSSGKINGALTFATGQNKVVISGPTLTNTNTFAAWVYVTAYTSGDGYESLIAFTGSLGIFLLNGTLDFYDSTATPIDKLANTQLSLNTWHHVAVVNNAGSVTFYLDGHPDGTATSVNGFTTNVIGGDSHPEPLMGTIDDVRIWNRALSAAEVTALYNDSAGIVTAPTSGLIGWWKFDDGSSGTTPTTAADSSGNGKTGTNQGSPVWTSSGKINNALTFNGTSQYVDTSNFADNLSNFTVTAWFKATGNGVIVSKLSSGGWSTGIGWLLGVHGLDLNGFIKGPSSSDWVQMQSGWAVNDGNWHHAAMVVTGGNTVTLYLDGTTSGTISTPGGPVTGYSNSSNVRIGMDYDSDFFPGTVDDVRIYNRALSAAEVFVLYNGIVSTLTSGLAGWWKLDEGSGTTTADSSGNGTTGTLTNGPAWATGKLGPYALTFNRTWNQYVDLGNPANLSFDINNPFSIAAWVYRITDTAEDNIFGKSSNGGTGYALLLTSTASWPYVADGVKLGLNANTNATMAWTSAGTLTTGAWHHVVATNDGLATGGDIKIYIDGQDSGANNANGAPAGSMLNAIDATIGGTLTVSAANSIIDDVRVYNRVLSAAEALALSGNTPSFAFGGGCAPSGLVGWWKLDDGTGTSAADSSGNGNTGTFSGTPLPIWTTSGKINGALTFAAGQNKVLIPGPTLTNTNTFAAWVYLTAYTSGTGYESLFLASGLRGIFLLNGTLDFYDSTATPIDKLANTQLSLNTWHHVAVVNNAGSVTFYLDGQPNGTATSVIGFALNLIGGDYVPEPLIGTLDDARVYNRALSGAEVKNLYNGLSGEAEGHLLYNASSHVPQFCDGTAWRATQ